MKAVTRRQVAILVALVIALGGTYVFKNKGVSVTVGKTTVAESAGPTSVSLSNYPAKPVNSTKSPFSMQPGVVSAAARESKDTPKPPIQSGNNVGTFKMAGKGAIEIRAIITPGQGRKVAAILSSGSEQIMVVEGAETPWGAVRDITRKGLYIGDTYYPVNPKPTFEEQGSEPGRNMSVPPIPSAPKTVRGG